MADIVSIIFLLVVVPFILMNFHNMQKAQKETIALLKETNRLLAEKGGSEKIG